MLRLRRRTLAVATAVLCAGVLCVAAWHVRPAVPAHIGSRPAPPAAERERGPGAATQDPPEGARSPRGDVFPYNRVVALTIGIDTYPNVFPPRNLSMAVADAVAIGDTFRDLFGYEVVPLHGPAATRAGSLEAVGRYGRELGPRDALIIYFAGHGQTVELPGAGEAGYLVPVEARLDVENRTDADRWRDQGLDMRALLALVNRANAGHVLVIADACCSGYLTTSRGALARYDLRNFLFDRSRTVLASTTRHQAATDGRFTAKLVERLRRLDPPDRQKPIAAASVYDLAFGLTRPAADRGEEVVFTGLLREVADDSKGEMTPQVAQVGDGDGVFVFVPAAADRRELEKDLRDLQEGGPVAASRLLRPVVDRRRAAVEQFTKPAEVYALLAAPNYRLGANPEDRQREWEQRLERFRRNAAGGDGWAMAALCLCSERGLGAKADPAEAYFWARQADRVEQPAGVGRYLLGRCYERGLGVPVSGPGAKGLSLRMYRESAAAGADLGRYGLARRTLADSASREPASQARRELEQVAGAGVLAAEVDLAHELWQSRPDLPGDRERALALLEGATKRGDARAHWLLAELYWTGGEEFPVVDLRKAESHLRQACELGSADAITNLAQMYRDGPKGALKLPTDYHAAFELYDRAAQAGHPTALVESAKMLADGRGTVQNHVLAKERIEAAVRAGNPWGDFIRGLWHLEGRVLQQDSRQALVSFRRAADAGHAGACFMAGQLYCQGRGFELRRRWEGVTAYHLDWYIGLHYLSRAWQLEVEGEDGLREFLGSTLRAFKGAVAGDELAFVASDGMREANAGKLGFVPFHFAAGAVAKDWRKEYPESFAWYCRKAALDPDTLKPLKHEPEKPAGK